MIVTEPSAFAVVSSASIGAAISICSSHVIFFTLCFASNHFISSPAGIDREAFPPRIAYCFPLK
jgi:hypothetical protein